MKSADDEKRLFVCADEEMLQQADVRLGSFIKYKSRFSLRFPTLADPFSSDWAITIADAREMLPDYASLANQSAETTSLDTIMAQGRELFQTLLLYTSIAFPRRTSLLKLMGQSQYESARKSQLKLSSLLLNAYAMASKPEFKPALIAKGMTEPEIESLNTLAKSISDQNIAQEKAKKDRSIDSKERVAAMNAVYEKMATVCQCAKLVFKDDAALYKLFLLYNGVSASPTHEVPLTPPSEN